MQVCKLTHETKGITIEKIVTKTNTVSDIKKSWRYTYGKLFFDCKFTIEGIPDKYRHSRVMDVDTGIIYENPSEAAKSVGVSIFTVYNHIHKKIKCKRPSFYYRFKFSDQ